MAARRSALGRWRHRTTALGESVYGRSWAKSDSRSAISMKIDAQQRLAADCLQRLLLRRSRFWQQLTASVAMTSNVKSWQQIFLGLHDFFVLSASEKPEPGRDDGCSCCSPWVGSHLPCLRRVPASGEARVSSPSLCTPPRVTPHRGCGFSDARWHTCCVEGAGAMGPVDLRGERNLCRHGPQASYQLTGNGPGDHMGVLPSCPEASGALTPPALGFPTDVLDDLREFFPSQLQVSTDFCGRARGPGAFDQSLAGMGVTGCGHRPLPASLALGYSEGIRPRHVMRALGVSKRVRSPMAATMVTATVHWTPRRAWSASTTGCKRHDVTWAWRACSRRWSRAVCS